jgi:N-acetylglucosamine malate deacetylase 1
MVRKAAFAVCAHPDDIEFSMAGTLLLLGERGYETHYMTIANGCYGSVERAPPEIAKIRAEEAKAAAQLGGCIFHGSLTDDMDILFERGPLRRLASVMREVSPEILLVHSPEDYMEDHTNACRLAVTAAFTLRMPYYPVEPPRAPVDQDVTLYHAQPHMNRDALGNPVDPDFFVNIESTLEKKREMLALHASQKDWLDRTQGMGSYVQAMVDGAATVGQLSGRFRYAEGWRKHHYAGYCAPDADPLAAVLGDLVTKGARNDG